MTTEVVFYSNVRDYLESLSDHETALERILQVVFGTKHRSRILFSCKLLIEGIKDPEFEETISEVLESNLPQALTCALEFIDNTDDVDMNIPLQQQFTTEQRARASKFLESALKMVKYGRGNNFSEWELRLIDDLMQFTRIPENPTRDQLIKQLELQLKSITNPCKYNTQVKSLYRMVNNFRCKWEDCSEKM